jgi:hypothetical protein
MLVDEPEEWPCAWSKTPCTLIFSTKQELLNHVLEKHLPAGSPSFSCNWKHCNRVLNNRNRLQVVSHVVLHFSKTVEEPTEPVKSPPKPAVSTQKIVQMMNAAINQGRLNPVTGLPLNATPMLPNPMQATSPMVSAVPPQSPMVAQSPIQGASPIIQSPLQGQASPQVMNPTLQRNPQATVGHSLPQPDPHDELRGIPLTALLIMRNLARYPENHALFAPYEAELTTFASKAKFSKQVGQILNELKI